MAATRPKTVVLRPLQYLVIATSIQHIEVAAGNGRGLTDDEVICLGLNDWRRLQPFQLHTVGMPHKYRPGDRIPVRASERGRVHIHALNHIVGQLTYVLEQCGVRIGVGQQSPCSVLPSYVPAGHLYRQSSNSRHGEVGSRSNTRVKEIRRPTALISTPSAY